MMNNADKNYIKLIKESCKLCGGRDSSCSCINNLRLEVKKIQARIPIKHRKFTLDSITHPQLETQKAFLLNYCNDLINNRNIGHGLYLYGNKGLAKSASAAAILTEALKNNLTAAYYESFNSCASGLIEDWIDKEKHLKNNILTTDFVVIDNVGEGFVKIGSNSVEEIRRMFRERSNALLPTIFVSGVASNEISDPVEQSILHLFKENTTAINFKGFNYEKHVLDEVKKKKQC